MAVANPSEKQAKIMVVDDDGPILRALTVRLEHAGYDVDPHIDASSALSALSDNNKTPHVALLDVNMPGLDGFKLAGEIKRIAPACRCMFLTASKAGQHRDKAAGLGIEFVEKPFDARDLLDRIKTACAPALEDA